MVNGIVMKLKKERTFCVAPHSFPSFLSFHARRISSSGMAPSAASSSADSLEKQIEKLTKKAHTLTVINTALQQENEKLREATMSSDGNTGRREFNDEDVAKVIRELEEEVQAV